MNEECSMFLVWIETGDGRMGLITGTGDAAEKMRRALSQAYGQAKPVTKPLPTVTTHDRFALVEPIPVVNGCQKLYLDIRLRMLTPEELAAAMGFPPSYKFSGTKTETVKQIGNAVQVDLAEKLTYAVLSHHLKAD